MRKDSDLIFLGDYPDSWYVDYDTNQFIALDSASDEVKKAVANLNRKLAEDKRRGTHRF